MFPLTLSQMWVEIQPPYCPLWSLLTLDMENVYLHSKEIKALSFYLTVSESTLEVNVLCLITAWRRQKSRFSTWLFLAGVRMDFAAVYVVFG